MIEVVTKYVHCALQDEVNQDWSRVNRMRLTEWRRKLITQVG